MTKKQLEEQVESLTSSLAQANEVVTFVFNVSGLWRKKDIGNYKAIKTISEMFVIKKDVKDVSKKKDK